MVETLNTHTRPHLDDITMTTATKGIAAQMRLLDDDLNPDADRMFDQTGQVVKKTVLTGEVRYSDWSGGNTLLGYVCLVFSAVV